jgi:hypothetical protein
MNKSITVVILLVVLSAMGLVMYFHTSAPKEETVLQASAVAETPRPAASVLQGPVTPLESPQGDSGGLNHIDPPLSSRDGIPKPVNLTSGSDGKPARPIEPARIPRENGEAGRTALIPPAAVPPAPPSPLSRSAPERDGADSLPQAGTAQPGTFAGETQPTKPEEPEKSDSGSPGLTPWKTPPPASGEKKTAIPAAPDAGRQIQPKEAEKPIVLSDKASHALKNIAFSFSGQNLRLLIQADSPFPCKAFALTGPDRLVIDLPGTWKDMKAPVTPQNRLVRTVRLGAQPAGPRLVLDLIAPLKRHSVEREGSSMTILLQ